MKTFLSINSRLLTVVFLLWVVVPVTAEVTADSIAVPEIVEDVAEEIERLTLSEADLVDFADSLGVDLAAVKAVIEIEAGKTHQGFWAEGKPLVNFDLAVFRKRAAGHHINLNKYAKSHAVVFNRPDTRKYGSYQAAQQARLDAAATIDSVAAIESTFWGMFQIGGFNWKKCGASSPGDFAERMALSEREQLHLFGEFLKSTGLDKHLRKHDWRAFARGYNGTSYAKRGYHTRLANAYKKYHEEAAPHSGK